MSFGFLEVKKIQNIVKFAWPGRHDTYCASQVDKYIRGLLPWVASTGGGENNPMILDQIWYLIISLTGPVWSSQTILDMT